MRLCGLLLLTPLALQPVLGQEASPVVIGGVPYAYVDPGEPFRERPAAPPTWEPPTPTPAERRAGLLAYATSDPGEYRPDRLPKPDEHAAELRVFLTPGEDEPLWVGVWGLEALQGLRAEVNRGSAPVAVDVRHAHFWPQRTGWRSREWYMTPELLLPCGDGTRLVPTTRGLLEERAFDLAAQQTAVFWITLTAAPEARPGTYRAAVRIRGEGRPALRLPLRIEILPFRLQRPDDRFWLLYADGGRWSAMSEAQVLAELRDFARHGITGLVEGPLGTPDLSRLKGGEVDFDASPYLELAERCRAAGLPGPHVCSHGGVPERVRDALGAQCDLMQGEWPAEVAQGVEAVARAACAATKDAAAKWYFYGWDEPSGDNTYAIQDYQAWRRGGAETYATFYQIGFLEKASEYLTAPCFVVGLISNEEQARLARETCERTGAEFWWYGTGSYVNPYPQEGHLFHNRYGAGFLFWKSGAKAEVTWTFCRPHEDVFNDFDGSPANAAEPKEQATTYPHLLKPDDWSTYQGAIPTLAWEGLREGVDDYLYLYTLTALIADGRDSREATARDAAERAATELQQLVEAIPWTNPMNEATFDTRRLHDSRRAVADLILELQSALGEEG